MHLAKHIELCNTMNGPQLWVLFGILASVPQEYKVLGIEETV